MGLGSALRDIIEIEGFAISSCCTAGPGMVHVDETGVSFEQSELGCTLEGLNAAAAGNMGSFFRCVSYLKVMDIHTKIKLQHQLSN